MIFKTNELKVIVFSAYSSWPKCVQDMFISYCFNKYKMGKNCTHTLWNLKNIMYYVYEVESCQHSQHNSKM